MALGERFAGKSVAEIPEEGARQHPERACLRFGDRKLTYAQLATRAAALAAALHELGVEPGDRIALDLPNWPEFVIAMFAAARLGAVIVPLNPRYTVPELQYMLRHSEATVVISAENFGGVDYLQLFEGFLTSLPTCSTWLRSAKDLWLTTASTSSRTCSPPVKAASYRPRTWTRPGTRLRSSIPPARWASRRAWR
jgi:fatty-acyl-CoA synthase